MENKTKRSTERTSQLFCNIVSALTSTISLVCMVILLIIIGGFLFLYVEGKDQEARISEEVKNINSSKSKLITEYKKKANDTENIKTTLRTLKKLLDSINLDSSYNTVVKAAGMQYSSGSNSRKVNSNEDKIHQMKLLLNRYDTRAFSGIPISIIEKSFDKIIDEIIHLVLKGAKKSRISSFELNKTLPWTYGSAVLYSVTVLSTIGYGNIVPVTKEGKLVTIIYALIGIPITLLCLANIGSLLAKFLNIMYRKLRMQLSKLPCTFPFSSVSRQPSVKEGRGDSLPSNSLPDNRLLGKNMLLLSSNSTKLTKITQSTASIDLADQRIDFTLSISARDLMNNINKTTNKVELPIYVPFLIFFIYIMLAAYLISLWEQWTLLNSFYFSFITFSTIGFGDFVPKFMGSEWKNQMKSFVCAIYLLLGLSLLSMCFQIVQDRLKRRAKRLAKQMGLFEPSTSV